jgi:hypothetical protein
MSIPQYEKLIEMPMDEVIKRYNDQAIHSQEGAGFWLDEIDRKEQRKYSETLRSYTHQTMILTYFIAGAVIFDIVFHIFFN